MESNKNLSTSRLVIAIFSDANFLALNLLENLVSKNCFVYVVCKDVNSWISKTSPINVKSKFSIVDLNNFNQTFQYSVILSGFLKGEPYENVNSLFNKISFSSSKNLIVIPVDKYDEQKNKSLKVPENIGIFYVSDLLGPRLDTEGDLLISKTISRSFYKRIFLSAVGEVYYPMFVSDLAKNISKWMFSFGPYGKEEIVLGPQVSATDLWNFLNKISPGIKLSYDNQLALRKFPTGYSVRSVDCNIKISLTETLTWLSKSATPIFKDEKKEKKVAAKKNRPPKKYVKILRPVIIFTLLLLFMPAFLLFISGGLDYFAYKSFLGNHDTNSQNLFLISKTLSVVSKEESRGLSAVPFLGKFYKEVEFASNVSSTVSDVAILGMPVVRNSSLLLNSILGNKVYDPTPQAQEIKNSLGAIYQKIAIFQAYTEDASNKDLLLGKLLSEKIDIETLKNTALQGETLAENIPSLIGKGQPKTYLLLFQNNMELRPTGGFIGSFGLVTFDSGRLSDLIVNDVYSADGQLNGHVEPPLPIKNYLGEANWWLRDSNWDPDFPTSAKRAEWFLDKEVGKEVDGVISLDLDPIKKLLKITGPVFLSDYNLNITADNLYENTQSEVESNFFPGSHKKASFLTALSRNLISDLNSLNSSQRILALKNFYTDLNQRHIQIFVHNEVAQKAISSLLWDGEVGTPDCGATCYTDLTGVVEANVGVNKANYFIKRSVNLDVSISAGQIKRTMTINLKNNSNPALGASGKYKVYVRALTNVNSKVLGISVVMGDTVQTVNPEISELKGWQEIGVLMEVLSGQSKSVVFSWVDNTPFKDDYSLYGLYVRKQAGVDSYPFTLTVNGHRVYNGQMSQDYFNRLSILK